MLILSPLLISVFIEDLLNRSIAIWQLISLSVVSLVLTSDSLELIDMAYKLAWVCSLFIVVTLYSRLRFGSGSTQRIGSGDWLFLIAISPIFPFQQFVTFVSTGFIFSLFTGLLVRRFQTGSTIPLAGLLSIWVLIVCLFGEDQIYTEVNQLINKWR